MNVDQLPRLSKTLRAESSVYHACEMFSQSKQQDRYVSQSSRFISPVEHVLEVGITGKPNTVQFIPILDILKSCSDIRIYYLWFWTTMPHKTVLKRHFVMAVRLEKTVSFLKTLVP